VALGDLLIDGLGITPPSLVSLVGGGGKTTLMHALFDAGTARGWRCAAGTTTKVYAHQADGLPGFLHSASAGEKLIGVSPEFVDEWFDQKQPDLLVIEADGSRGRRVKAPSTDEPPIPGRSTLVIAVIGADSIDRVIEDVAHRPMRVAAVCGCGPYGRLTPERAALLLASERGSRKNVPVTARFAVAITRIGPRQRVLAMQLSGLLAAQAIPTVLLDSLDEPRGEPIN